MLFPQTANELYSIIDVDDADDTSNLNYFGSYREAERPVESATMPAVTEATESIETEITEQQSPHHDASTSSTVSPADAQITGK